MKLRASLALVVLLTACGSVTPPVPPETDVSRCASMTATFVTLKDAELVPLTTGTQPNYTELSRKVGTYAANLRESAPAVQDPGVRAAWTLVASQGELAAAALLSANLGKSLDALSPFIRSATAGIEGCTELIKAATPS